MLFAIIASLMLPPNPPVHDAMNTLPPAGVAVQGWLSPRVDANTRRLIAVELGPLLEGFRHKPGVHPWIGEHIGKWMHAATLAWEYSREPDAKAALRRKLDAAAAGLVAAQEADGYLGTYVPAKRFGLYPEADWDVWSHKYCMIGLMAYARATGDKPALDAARRAADLLIATFGPGKRSIVTAGTHAGMAATSVIEPLVQLAGATGDTKYLDFALHVADSYNDPDGPRLLESLLSHGDVARTANGKAYEMLSNCVGLCELFRATGDRRFLDAARNAFDDVVANQLYVTGAASHHEHFHQGHDLPNAVSANVGETCVTVTWIQLCEQLLRLTGEPRYADELERALYNHLAAAQHPQRGDWCYYTSLDGAKPYTAETCCCLSSGPRAMAMAPSLVFLTEGDRTLVVNLFEDAEAAVSLAGTTVDVRLATGAPLGGDCTITLAPRDPRALIGLLVRTPSWAEPMVADASFSPTRDRRGWLSIAPRRWSAGEPLKISFPSRIRAHRGVFSNNGKLACTRGPLVLCFQQRPDDIPAPLIWLDDSSLRPSETGAAIRARSPRRAEPFDLALVPFSNAGTAGEPCRVWLNNAAAFDPSAISLACAGAEQRSVAGNVAGSIIDADPASYVVTYDNTRHAEDWFGVRFKEPVEFTRVVFTHGRTFHDGGWFDTSAGPPRIGIINEGGATTVIGTLDTYPRTTGESAAGLKGGETFEVRFPAPVRASGVLVIGVPAHGDTPSQSFASCAELSIFRE